MSRPDRLFRLLQLMRSLPAPVTATRLAEETGVSPRTLYRDIDSLRAAGAGISGEAGYGYTLTEDPALPPMMFTRLEVEALLLGLATVTEVADPDLHGAARDAVAKVVATLPEQLQRQAMHSVLKAYRYGSPAPIAIDVTALRRACWDETEVRIAYCDAEGRATERQVRPLAIVYLEYRMMLLAWCTLRRDFRKFALDRMQTMEITEVSFRPHRATLLEQMMQVLSSYDGPPLERAATGSRSKD